VWETCSVAATPDIDRNQLAYFAISVFWHASGHTWEQDDGEIIRIDLDGKYNEEIRKYLREESPVPRHAYLQLTVCCDVLNQRSFVFPQENEKVIDRSEMFLARGLTFFFRISRTLTG